MSVCSSYRIMAFNTLHIPPCLHVASSTIRHELSWCKEVGNGSLVLKNSVHKGSIGLFFFSLASLEFKEEISGPSLLFF